MPEGQLVVKLNHRQLLQQVGLEACLCEDPSALVDSTQVASYKKQALEAQPAAGEAK